MDKRRMCPNCRAFISADDKVCPYCDTPLGPRAVDRRPSSFDAGFFNSPRFTTVIILLINAGLYAATALYSMKATNGEAVLDIDPRTLFEFGAKQSAYILRGGEWWRLITAGFLHGGILHILMNSWVIFDLGTTVEEFFGTSRYLVLYFVTTVCGFLASTLWNPGLSVGASAALFGLLGAMIAFGIRHRSSPMGAIMRAHYTQWALWGLAMGFLPGFRVDNAAHIGGLVSGFVMGYLVGTPPLFDRWTERVWRIAAGLCAALFVIAMLKMLMSLTSVE